MQKCEKFAPMLISFVVKTNKPQIKNFKKIQKTNNVCSHHILNLYSKMFESRICFLCVPELGRKLHNTVVNRSGHVLKHKKSNFTLKDSLNKSGNENSNLTKYVIFS